MARGAALVTTLALRVCVQAAHFPCLHLCVLLPGAATPKPWAWSLLRTGRAAVACVAGLFFTMHHVATAGADRNAEPRHSYKPK